MEEKKKYYITTPIYYPSDNLHIGHAYTTVAADAEARYRRLKGYDVMFLTGTDEHGQKIQRKAEAKGVTPKQYVDEIVTNIKSLWKLFDISNDKFIRTTDDYHVKAVQKIFKQLYDKGDIYKSEYEGWYCTPCESFWTETQAKDGICPDCGRKVEKMKEESYFFRLSKYQDRLIDYIETHPDFIQPVTRKNEMLNNFLRPGLDDLCVSRTTFSWGIPVTFDDKHIVYVWVDALSNYITAMGYGSEDDSDYRKFWPADLHLVGKEIVRFHTIIWPAILMALDLPLPKQVYGHGWLLIGDTKMSKSKGNVVDPVILCDKYGSDAIRYFLLREVPFGSDGSFTNESLISRINSDLANDLGNLVSRSISMQVKYFGGVMPETEKTDGLDAEVRKMLTELKPIVESYTESLQFPVALSEIWKCVSRLNKYIDEKTPWVLAKDESRKDELAAVMGTLLEGIRIIGIMLIPFLPKTAPEILRQIGLEGNKEACDWESTGKWGLYKAGTTVQKGNVLFPRIDVAKDLAEFEALSEAAKKKAEQLAKEQNGENEEKAGLITIDDFKKVELKVAVVKSAEKVEGSDKLLKLSVSTGDSERTVVSGIAKQYTPEEIIGKKVILVSNLATAKLKGIESCGMLLAATCGKKLSLLTVDSDIPEGSTVS